MKRNRSGPRLWTKDFSCITIATVLSAIGGEAMNLPISLLVFDETKSTLLSALILVCGMLPDMILPILVAPLIDKGGKKKCCWRPFTASWASGFWATPFPTGCTWALP